MRSLGAGLCAVILGLALAGCGGGGNSEQDKAEAAAKDAYELFKKSGGSLENGPCISEQLPGVKGWAADVAHDPREPVDDQPANQCQSLKNGQSEHFVELDPNGELIRTG